MAVDAPQNNQANAFYTIHSIADIVGIHPKQMAERFPCHQKRNGKLGFILGDVIDHVVANKNDNLYQKSFKRLVRLGYIKHEVADVVTDEEAVMEMPSNVEPLSQSVVEVDTEDFSPKKSRRFPKSISGYPNVNDFFSRLLDGMSRMEENIDFYEQMSDELFKKVDAMAAKLVGLEAKIDAIKTEKTIDARESRQVEIALKKSKEALDGVESLQVEFAAMKETVDEIPKVCKQIRTEFGIA